MQQPGKHFVLTIPTKTYLKKYLNTLYGSPIVFTTINYFGMSLIGFLERKFYNRDSNEVITYQKFDVLNDQVNIHLPRHWLAKNNRGYGYDINTANIILLNKLFEERFEEDLCRFCLVYASAGVEIKDAIEEFCRLFSISLEEDISYEAVKKKEYRYRKKMEELFTPHLSREKSVIPDQLTIYPIW